MQSWVGRCRNELPSTIFVSFSSVAALLVQKAYFFFFFFYKINKLQALNEERISPSCRFSHSLFFSSSVPCFLSQTLRSFRTDFDGRYYRQTASQKQARSKVRKVALLSLDNLLDLSFSRVPFPPSVCFQNYACRDKHTAIFAKAAASSPRLSLC